MKRLLFAVTLAVIAPSLVSADMIYFRKPGETGIQSVAGKVVREHGGTMEIQTNDGATMSISKSDVFQIVPDAPVHDTRMTDGFQNISSDGATVDAPRTESSRGRTPSHQHYGIKGGMNMANVSADPSELEDADSLTSYALGGWWGMPLTRRLSIQAEALYSVKGDSETDGGYTASTQLSYIDIPVLAKIGFLHGGAAQPSLFLGPSMAFNVGASSTLEGPGTNTELDVQEQVRQFDFAVVVGGGVDIPVGRNTLGLDVRYSKGLSDVGDGANGSAYNDVIAVMGSIGLQ
jgi:hypothetical protein